MDVSVMRDFLFFLAVLALVFGTPLLIRYTVGACFGNTSEGRKGKLYAFFFLNHCWHTDRQSVSKNHGPGYKTTHYLKHTTKCCWCPAWQRPIEYPGY
jgi:hypothetical protein